MHTLLKIERDLIIPTTLWQQNEGGSSWEQVWSNQTEYTGEAQRLQRTKMKLQQIQSMGLSLTNKKVLDVGCGEGTTLEHLSVEHGCTGYGIDISPSAIELARQRHPNNHIYFRVGDGRDIPFPNGSFDIVFSWGVLEHAKNFQQSFAEARRVLRPGGMLVLIQPHLLSTGVIQKQWLRFLGRWNYGRQIDFSFWSLRRLLFEHGFSKVHLATQPATKDMPVVRATDILLQKVFPFWGHYLYALATK